MDPLTRIITMVKLFEMILYQVMSHSGPTTSRSSENMVLSYPSIGAIISLTFFLQSFPHLSFIVFE